MDNALESALSWLSEEEKTELTMLVGRHELGLDVHEINFKTSVRVAFVLYLDQKEILY
jgi:hypothetical protein